MLATQLRPQHSRICCKRKLDWSANHDHEHIRVAAAISGRTLGLDSHFRMQCPPCRAFTPTLVKLYEAVKKKSDTPFEIIYCSLDKSSAQFKEYFATMPWLAVPPEAADTLRMLQQKHSVMSVPTLLVFSLDGELLTRNGVAAVQKDPAGNNFPWAGHKQSAAQLALSSVMQTLPNLLLIVMAYLAWQYFFKK